MTIGWRSGSAGSGARQRPSRRIWVAAGLLALLYLGAGLALRVPVKTLKLPVSGDEQHYLTQTISLIEDGDLRVVNNYENGAYLRYYLNGLDPILWNLMAANEYSGHSPGTAIVLAPALWLLDWLGVLIALSGLMAAGFALTAFALARVAGPALRTRSIVLLALGFLAPQLFAYSHTIYPEAVLVPLLGGVTLLAVCHGQVVGRWRRIATGSAAISLAGLSIGLHPKHATLVMAVVAFFVAVEVSSGWRTRRRDALATAPLYVAIGIGWLLFFSWTHEVMWGTFHPFGWWWSLPRESPGPAGPPSFNCSASSSTASKDCW